MSAPEWLDAHLKVLLSEEPEMVGLWKDVISDLMDEGMKDVTVGRIHQAFQNAKLPSPKMTQREREERQ